MAFKMTPGIKGNPAQSRIAGLGACGGPGQPPCEPRFEKEVQEEKRMMAADRSISSKSIRSKVKVKAEAPIKPTPKPPQVKFEIILPKGFEFASKKEMTMFYEKMQEAIDSGAFKSQEELDEAVMQQLKAGPVKPPGDIGGPVIIDPDKPIFDSDPIKEVPKYESELNDKMKAASIEQAKARFAPIESSAASK